MNMSINIQSLNGWIHEYRKLLPTEKHLSDQEVRLFRIYRLLAGPYKKYPESYRRVFASYREIQRHYLPNWSVGKISHYTRKLESDGYITRIRQAVIYVQPAENYIQPFEQKVQNSEQSVQSTEQSSLTQEERERRIKELRDELAKKKSF